jgi:hypothetical protein
VKTRGRCRLKEWIECADVIGEKGREETRRWMTCRMEWLRFEIEVHVSRAVREVDGCSQAREKGGKGEWRVRDKLETGELGGIVEADPSRHKNPERDNAIEELSRMSRAAAKLRKIP